MCILAALDLLMRRVEDRIPNRGTSLLLVDLVSEFVDGKHRCLAMAKAAFVRADASALVVLFCPPSSYFPPL